MTERITASALIRSAALGKAEQADDPAPNTDESRTYQTITHLLETDNYAALFGYLDQTLRMVATHPGYDAYRQQAHDIARAIDDHKEKTQ